MTNNLDEMQKVGKEQMERFSSSASSVTRTLEAISTETSDFSKRALEHTADHVKKLSGVRSLDAAMQLQTEFAKSTVEAFVAHSTKIGEMYRDMAKDAFRPIEAAMNKGQ